MKRKSVLDDRPVKNQAFPNDKDYSSPPREKFAPAKPLLGIVGHCPCGAPIYGHAVTDEERPIVRFSCECKPKPPVTPGEVRTS